MEEAIPFSSLLETLCTNHLHNPKSQRTAAVASALVEVIQEKLGANSYEEVTPAAMFASALNAITASVMSSSSDKHESTTMDQSPQASFLEILSQIVPYVSSSNPNLYIHQFSALSRVLRGIVSSIPSPMHLSSNNNNNNSNDVTTNISAGWNALLRQCIRTSTIILNGILILENTKHLEKEILKCFHSTIVQHFDDPRAKVRRQAHSSAIELLSLSGIMMQENEDSVGKGKGMLNDLIPDQLVEYSHHILLVSNYISTNSTTGKKKKKKMDENNNKELMSI